MRHDAQVGLGGFPAAGELRLGLLVGDGRDDDHVLALLPVHWRRHLMLGGELKRIDDKKVQLLCVELGRTWPQNPNASALLVRAILLCALRHKIGRGAGDDLSAVLGQAIAQLGLDQTTIHILENFQKMPKTLLDATYHSQQMTFTEEEVSSFIVAIVKIVQGLYP